MHRRRSSKLEEDKLPVFQNTTDTKDEDESSGSESECRWDPNILNDVDCKLVFTDGVEDHLPQFFDITRVPME